MLCAVPAIRYFDVVSSTMDVARTIVTTAAARQQQSSDTTPPVAAQPEMSASPQLDAPLSAFGVVAKSQTSGRGTAGRSWLSQPGNLYYTICLPQAAIPVSILPVFPLVVGLSVQQAVIRAAQLPPLSETTSTGIRLKWPNDIVCDGKKLCGTLIEHEGDFLLVGIGVNVAAAPEVVDGGRQSDCVKSVMRRCGSQRLIGPSPTEIAEDIWVRLFTALDEARRGEVDRKTVVQRFQRAMDWSLTLGRRTEGKPLCRAVRMNEWGHLVVVPAAPREGTDASPEVEQEETLCSEYLL